MIAGVRAENFLSWETLEFEVLPKITLIEGFNHDDGTPEGSGKSAIPNAISWCLFGKLPKDAKVDEVIREGAKGCWVEVTLLDGTEIFRGRKPNDLYILPMGAKEPTKGKDAKETQEMIEKLLGFSFETFCQAVYFAQNYPKKFITSTEEEKAKILSEIQDLEQFTEARKRAASLAKAEETNVMVLERDLAAVNLSVSELEREIANYQGLREQFIQDRDATVSELRGQATKLERELMELNSDLEGQDEGSLQKTIRGYRADATNQEAEISELKEALGSLYAVRESHRKAKTELDKLVDNVKFTGYKDLPEDVERDLRSLAEKMDELSRQRGETSALISAQQANQTRTQSLSLRRNAKKQELDRLVREAEKFEGEGEKLCPTCGSVMNQLHVEKHLTEIEAKGKAVQEELDLIEEELASIPESNLPELRTRMKELEAQTAETHSAAKKADDYLKNLRKAEAEAKATSRRIDELKAFLAQEPEDPSELEAGISGAQTELKLLRDQTQELERQLALVQELGRRVRRVTEDLAQVQDRIEREASKEPTKLDENIKRSQDKLWERHDQRAKLRGQLSEKKVYLARLETLKVSFKEVKSYVFQGLLSELTRKANRYLSELFEVPIQLRFSNTGEDGEISKIEAQVEIDGNLRPLGLYSGGQFRRIQLAVDLALSEIIAARAGKPVSFRIFDEYCKDLSEVSMEKVLRLLEGLKGSTIVIEHNSLIKNVVNQTFRVELKDGVSRRIK